MLPTFSATMKRSCGRITQDGFPNARRDSKILKDAFDDKPKPKLVAMPGGRA
jgi:hypothetical protein